MHELNSPFLHLPEDMQAAVLPGGLSGGSFQAHPVRLGALSYVINEE